MKLTRQDERDLAAAFFVGGVALGALALLAEYGCTPAQREGGIVAVDASCRILEAFGGTPAEVAICATAAELARIARDVVDAHDAGAAPASRKAGAHELCRTIPGSDVCATDAELAPAIRRALEARQDGGRP